MTPLTRAEIEARQLDGLRELRAALVPANRIYAPRPAAFSEQVPFSRVAGQQALAPLSANWTCPVKRHRRFGQTSRTSGGAPRSFDAPLSEARA